MPQFPSSQRHNESVTSCVSLYLFYIGSIPQDEFKKVTGQQSNYLKTQQNWGVSPKHVLTPEPFNKLTDCKYYSVCIPRHCESVGLGYTEACHFSQPLYLSGEVWFHYLGHEVTVPSLSGFSVCSNSVLKQIP